MNRTITSYEDLKNAISSLKLETFSSHSLLFRGQGNNNWKLTPSLVRGHENHLTSEDLAILEQEQFNKFKNEYANTNKIQKPFFKNKHQEDWLLLQQQQHLESNTSLIDWTFDYKIALFFAIEDRRLDIYNGQLWVFVIENEKVKKDFDGEYLNYSPFEIKESGMVTLSGFLDENYSKKLGMRKKNSQFGAFYLQPYSEIHFPLEKRSELQVIKLIIPKEIKSNLRMENWFIDFHKKYQELN